MDPATLAVIIEELILKADSRFNSLVGRVQKDLYSQLVTLLKDLDVDTQGYIKQTAANRKILISADRVIGNVFNEPMYNNAVATYVLTVPKIDLQNIKYFVGIESQFTPNKQFLKNLQKNTIKSIEKYVLQDGLQSQVVDPLNQILNQNINSGGKFSGFLKQLEEYVVGNDTVEGRLLNYTRTYLRDSLFTYSRTYQQSVTSDLGLEYYLYSGGIMDTTRPFCLERAGQYFSKKEIEMWASQEWRGKKAGTTESSIFLFAGGWNCGHQIIPVSNILVPQEVIDRNT